DKEKGINAFVAGYKAGDTVVVVTQGALDNLSRDELQAVIGHEFSHILNGDMVLNMKLLAMVFGITCLAQIGLLVVENAGGADDLREVLGAIVIGLFVALVGGVGVLIGSLLQCAISRQRESLADATSLQLTRNPLGLRNALLKIAGLQEGSKIKAPAG